MRDRKTLHFARQLRKQATDAEKHLWRCLRCRQLERYRFRRQVPIAGYIAHFACFEAKLVVELDGGQHGEQRNSDAVRDHRIEQAGFRVLRFWDDEVFKETEAVLQKICDALMAPSPTLPRASRKGG
jgi:very-short-patch-repair endonuclease